MWLCFPTTVLFYLANCNISIWKIKIYGDSQSSFDKHNVTVIKTIKSLCSGGTAERRKGKERVQWIVSASGQMMMLGCWKKKTLQEGGKLLPQQRQELSSIVQPHKKKTKGFWVNHQRFLLFLGINSLSLQHCSGWNQCEHLHVTMTLLRQIPQNTNHCGSRWTQT